MAIDITKFSTDKDYRNAWFDQLLIVLKQLETVHVLVQNNPNDMDLGNKVRELIINNKIDL